MKGFNIAPPQGSSQLQPTAAAVAAVELIASLDGTNGGKKSPGTRLARLARFTGQKRDSSKKRWGTIIEAAKSGRVKKLISRSRSEDSMCSNSSRNSPPLDVDNDSSPSDSNQSIPSEAGGSVQSGISGPFAALSGLRFGRSLKKKESKFNRTRNPIPLNPIKLRLSTDRRQNSADGDSGLGSGSLKSGGSKKLKRTASVPVRTDIVKTASPLAEVSAKPRKSIPREPSQEETTITASAAVVLATTSTTPVDVPVTESSQQAPAAVSTSSSAESSAYVLPSSSRDPLLVTPPVPPPSSSQEQQQEPHKSKNGSAVIPNLPGIQPVGGHQMSAGWL